MYEGYRPARGLRLVAEECVVAVVCRSVCNPRSVI